MCCLFLSAAFVGPRFALLLVWIFGDRIQLAYDTWFWPFLGLLFLPWTTLFYAFAWSPAGGVDGADWIFVGLGLALDIVTYASRSATQRARQAY